MFTIRYMERTDKAFWYRLDRHLPETEFENKAALRRGYVLSLDSQPAGILRYNLFWDNTPFCTLLYIDAPYRGQGGGRRLMEHWEQEMRAQGYPLVLTSTQVDETAQHFYRRLGYKDCGGLLLDASPCTQPMELFLAKPL